MKLIFDNLSVEDARELLSCVDIKVENLKFTEESDPSASTNKQGTPFVKCDDCDEIADYHYCSECMDNHRN